MSLEKKDVGLQDMSEMIERNNKLIEKKLYMEIEENLSYKEQLCKLTRDEMSEMAENWGIGKLSKLNKDSYADKIQETVIENIDNKLRFMNNAQYKFFEELISNKGILRNSNTGIRTLLYYRNNAITFSGISNEEKITVVSEGILDSLSVAVKNVEKKAQDNDEIIKVVRGILYNYGIMEVKEIHELVCNLLKVEIEEEYFEELLTENSKYEEFIRVEKIEEKIYICNSKLTNATKIIEKQNSMNIGLWKISKEVALECGKYRYSEWYKAHMEFKQYLLNNYDVEEGQAIIIVDACIMGLKDGNTLAETYRVLEMCLNITDEFTERIVKKFLINMQNTTRLWGLKGYMPQELEVKSAAKKPSTIVKGKKVGRNEICTCGSGRKYKKCCGRNN